VVTTIQKLDKAISKQAYLSKIEHLKNARVIFLFDECHRSQFGDTHKRINKFFEKAQLFGFTGTPIFEKNSTANEHGKRTTKTLFEECLHRYVITDAIKDENVLKFSIEYVGRYKRRVDSQNEIDINVEDIDRKELMESPIRLQKISEYILAQHERKTHAKQFTALFCVSSVDVLIQYYDILKSLKEQGRHNLNIATIFSYTANEEDKDASGFIPDDLPDMGDDDNGSKAPVVINKHSRDKLEEYIGEYNAMFGTSFTTKDTHSFYNYYTDIAKRVKSRNIDILLVVNMFLTGFDSKWLNTLYVDKNLKYHGLVQAFSRTNRILNETKSQGNIVCFRNLKEATDEAIALFSDKDAKEDIIIAPYEEYTDKFNKAVLALLAIAPTVKSVDKLVSEEDELAFIKAFRELMRLKNVLTTFADFSFADLSMSEQAFEDYKSKYLDLYDKVRTDRDKQKESILQEVDFELELIHRDEINVTYILKLLAKFKNAKGDDITKQRKSISDIISGDPKLRSKKELIDEFIDENLVHVTDGDDIPEAFLAFIAQKQSAALTELCATEKLDPEKFSTLLENHLFTGRIPLDDEIVACLTFAPKLLERLQIVARIKQQISDFVETFINGIG
jgi:type I restriction enzyme R subunit